MLEVSAQFFETDLELVDLLTKRAGAASKPLVNGRVSLAEHGLDAILL